MTSWQRHMVKNVAQSFCNSKLNVLAKFYEKWITGTNLLKKEFDSDSRIFDKIAIIQEQIKLLV